MLFDFDLWSCSVLALTCGRSVGMQAIRYVIRVRDRTVGCRFNEEATEGSMSIRFVRSEID